MGQNLTQIARQLYESDKKVQLIYAFNGTGKTRLSREFKSLVYSKSDMEVVDEYEAEIEESSQAKILYYNAFTEDLFSWDNDLQDDVVKKLKIQPNNYTKWIFKEQGKWLDTIKYFQRYTNDKLTPNTNPDFSEVTFSFERGNEEREDNIKISKGEESNFIWSMFYTIIEQAVETLNEPELDNRGTIKFNDLEYIFIDDPVSSLDENHLIELAVNIATQIKKTKSNLKFVITTHNPLFYNVLQNELGRAQKYQLNKNEDGSYLLTENNSDTPFSYHLYIKQELEKAIKMGTIKKYHYNFLRNLLEKTSVFLGYDKWGDLLPQSEDGKPNPYEARMINLNSHSHHMGEEVRELTDDDKRVLTFLVENINEPNRLQFKSE